MFQRYLLFTNVHIIALITALLTFPMLFQFTPEDDCAARYAQLAEAFAAGNFEMAFHSRFLPLYPILTGIFAYAFKCSGYFACKFICWLFFSLSVYPIYAISMRIKGNKTTAAIASYMLLFCYPLVAFIGDGTRENLKGFLILAGVWALISFWKSEKIKYAVLVAIAIAGLSLTRGDSSLFVLIFIAIIAIKDIISGKIKNALRTALVIAIYLILLCPWLYFQYHNVGYPVPETRHAVLLNKMQSHLPFLKIFNNPQAKYNIEPQQPQQTLQTPIITNLVIIDPAKSPMPVQEDVTPKLRRQNTVLGFVQGFIKGLYPFFFILAVFGMVYRIKQKEWNAMDTILLTLFAGHIVTVILQIAIADHTLYVSSRYLQSAIPLYLAWSAVAIYYIYTRTQELLPGKWHWLPWAVCVVIMIPSYQQGIKQLFHEYCKTDLPSTEIKKMITIMRKTNFTTMPGSHTPYECRFVSSPIVITSSTAIGYYTKTATISFDKWTANQKEMLSSIKSGQVKFLIIRAKQQDLLTPLMSHADLKELYRGKNILYSVNTR